MKYENDLDGKVYEQFRTERKQRNRESQRRSRRKNQMPTTLQDHYDKKWLESNRERLLKHYHKKLQDDKLTNQLKRRVLSSEEDTICNNLTYKEWLGILELYNHRCAYCGTEFMILNLPEIDHIIPISKGGSNTKNNIIPACRSCNSKKGNKLLESNMLFKEKKKRLSICL